VTFGTFFSKKSEEGISSENLKLTLAAQPAMPTEVRRQFQATIDEYSKTMARLRSEPETREGTEELSARARAIEHSREMELRHRYYFEYGRSLYQMSIVIAVGALISGSSLVLYLSGIPALFGFVMLISGFSQLDWLP
jgi:hypothetical protein